MSSTREQDGSCVGCILLRSGRVPRHLHPTHNRGGRTALAASIAPTLEACDARTTTAMPTERGVAHPPQRRTPGASSAASTSRAVVAFPRVTLAKRFALPQSLFCASEAGPDCAQSVLQHVRLQQFGARVHRAGSVKLPRRPVRKRRGLSKHARSTGFACQRAQRLH